MHKTVTYQFTLDGEFIARHESSYAAAVSIGKPGIAGSNISRIACGKDKGRTKAYGYRWSNKRKLVDILNIVKVYQFTLKGEYVDCYKSLAEASRVVGCCCSNLSAVLNSKSYHKTVYGFLWSRDRILNIQPGKTTRTAVQLTGVDGTHVFESQREAGRFLNIHNETVAKAAKSGCIINGYQIQFV